MTKYIHDIKNRKHKPIATKIEWGGALYFSN